jgi:hypothetical protein
MAKPPSNKTKTQPGLGSGNGLPRLGSTEMTRVRGELPPLEAALPPPAPVSAPKRLRDSIRREELPDEEPVHRSERPTGKRVRDSIRREETDEPVVLRSDHPAATTAPPAPNARRTASWQPEPPTGTRSKERTIRPPVTVDEVGVAAVKIARSRREGAPKLIASRAVIAKAPIDTRAAFVLSLVDGRNTATAIVDMSGMLEDEVKAILDRLARLGLISLP